MQVLLEWVQYQGLCRSPTRSMCRGIASVKAGCLQLLPELISLLGTGYAPLALLRQAADHARPRHNIGPQRACLQVSEGLQCKMRLTGLQQISGSM